MPTYLHPGVYVEEIPSGSKPIEGVGTSTAAFLGFTVKGPVEEPVLISKWDDYQNQFGGIQNTETDVSGSQFKMGDPMGHAVYAFFQNGGTKAYIVRTVKDTESSVGYALHPDADANNPQAADKLVEFTAANPGKWGDELVARITKKDNDDEDLFIVEVGFGKGDDFEVVEGYSDVSMDADKDYFIEKKINSVSNLVQVKLGEVESHLSGQSISEPLADDFDPKTLNGKEMKVAVNGTNRNVEFAADKFDDASTNADVAAEIQKLVRGAVQNNAAVKDFTCVVNAEKSLVLTAGETAMDASVVVTGAGDADDAAKLLGLGDANEGEELTGSESFTALLAANDGADIVLSGGANGDDADSYDSIFTKFLKYRDINILLLPGKWWNDDDGYKPYLESAIAHCEKMKNRAVIIDLKPGEELDNEKDVNDKKLPTSTYANLYYPWIKAANPYYDADLRPGAARNVLVPSSAYAAGMWAKIDGRRGVWKAPAGVETNLLGLSGTEFVVENAEQDYLNPLGVNAVRTMPGYGSVIWGARTLSTKANPEWRYVPVRRTAMYIEESIFNGIQWAVFEPNDHRLWSSLRANIDSFMNGMFRAGAFQGQTANDAYFVRCGLGDTMTQGDIDGGQVIVVVGFAPVKPAEFVIVRIQQKVGNQ